MCKQFENELNDAINLAKEAGDYLLKNKSYSIFSDNGKDIKISSDRISEKIIMDGLSHFGYSILSEEYGLQDLGTDLIWIVDPLDGTMNYAKNMRELTCISIALWDKDRPILGVVYKYETDDLFYGIVGEGAYLNGEKITCSSTTDISKAILGTGFPVRRDYTDEAIITFVNDSQRYKKVRMLGTAALMVTYVACGRMDVYKEENVMLWDIAAGIAIVEASGGKCELLIKENNKCECRCYANKALAKQDKTV